MDPYNRPLYPHSGAPSARADSNDYYYQQHQQHQHAAGYGEVPAQHGRYYADASPSSVTGHHAAIEPWTQSHHAGPSPPLPGAYWPRHSALHAADAVGPPHYAVESLHGYPQSPLSPTGGSVKEEGSMSPASDDADQSNSVKSKKYKCPMEQCGSAFARKADKDRHYECVHNRARNKKYECRVETCNRRGESGFTRKDHLREHLRNFHHHVIPKKNKSAYKKDGQ